MSKVEYDRCMKCNKTNVKLLFSYDSVSCLGYCSHIFCVNCFKNENLNKNINLITSPKCPCCKKQYYEYIQSIDEAALIGEAAYLNSKAEQQSLLTNADPLITYELRNQVIENLEDALLIIPSESLLHLIVLKCILHICLKVLDSFRIMNDQDISPADRHKLEPMMQANSHDNSYERHYFMQRVYECCIDFINNGFDNNGCSLIHSQHILDGQPLTDSIDWYHHTLASIFKGSGNVSASFKHAQLAYDICLHSSDRSRLDVYERELKLAKGMFDKESPLRFPVGAEIEFLIEVDNTSEWCPAKIVELYYRERDFPLVFTSPYRLMLKDSAGPTSRDLAYAWVKADLDRYIRKPGVKLIEDTRYQARLEAKAEELAQVFRSKEFVHDIYLRLKEDREFIEMLNRIWRITLSERTLFLYRIFEMYRHPLVRTDSGYHVPTAGEVIAGIRAFFDPADRALASSSAAADSSIADAKRVKAVIIAMLQELNRSADEYGIPHVFKIDCKEAIYMRTIISYPALYRDDTHPPDMSTLFETGFTVPLPSGCIPPDVSFALATVAGIGRLEHMIPDPLYASASTVLILYKSFVNFLDKAGSACECPFVYFFVKFCLDQGVGVPKPALVIYDRMNMQLSREFIRCANPTCELNRLDQSTGQVKFKKCSRCLAVIYCSRECQVAHYPEHKRLCRAHSTG